MTSGTEQALGLIETRGLVAPIEAADAGVKAAPVTLLGSRAHRPGRSSPSVQRRRRLREGGGGCRAGPRNGWVSWSRCT